MQKAISNKVQIGETLNPARDYSGVSSINDEGTLENVLNKVDKGKTFIATGRADADMGRYYPYIYPISRQSQIASDFPKKAYASDSYVDKKRLEFTIQLTASSYTNYSTMEVVIPIKFTKKSDKTSALDKTVTTVNNFFGHWFKDIEVLRYPDDKQILPTNNTVSVANYSNAQLKYLPTKALKPLEKTLLYSNVPVYYINGEDRRSIAAATLVSTTNLSGTAKKNAEDKNEKATAKAIEERSDFNLIYRLKTFKTTIDSEKVYRIPLLYLCELGKVNFSINTDTRINIILERNLNKLFESNKVATAIPENPDAHINFFARPYISYQETHLTQQAGLYQNGILRSRTALRQGVVPAPFQQEFEVAVGTQNFTCLFQGAQRQIDWVEISILYDKSYHHETIYDSYDVELAPKLIKTIKFDNASTTYSLTGQIEYNLEKEDDRNILYKMLAAFQCGGYSSATLSQFINNPVYQDMTREEMWGKNYKDDRLLIDLRRSKGYTDELEKIYRDDSQLSLTINLKAATTKKLRFRIVGWSQGEYWYVLNQKGYIMSFKNYNISKQDKHE